jgi:tetratricopeptide (TPR) repeat protein
MTNQLPISVCMIVRDEEINLPDALTSVRSLVDEILVLDTGSVDRTVEIATAMGARVLTYEWQDDFAAARNVSIEAARHDWILVLDADQRLAPDMYPLLSRAINQPCMAQMVSIQLMANSTGAEVASSYTALRLFRRDARIRYRGRVHEDIADALIAAGHTEWPDSGIALHDIGYIEETERQRKRERNLNLLARSRDENPDDLFVAYKLAITLPASEHAQRLHTLTQAMQRARALPLAQLREYTFMPKLLAAAVEAYVAQGNLCAAADIAQALLPATGHSGYFTAGRALARSGQFALADQMLRQYLSTDATQASKVITPDPEASIAEACYWLGWLYRLAGQPAEAQAWLTNGMAHASTEQHAMLACEAIRIQLDAGELNGINEQLNALYPLAQTSTSAHADVMLISAELAVSVGDHAGALELAKAALTEKDDRAAALIAQLELHQGMPAPERMQALLSQLPGHRFDTLAVRLTLEESLGIARAFEIPEQTLALLG